MAALENQRRAPGPRGLPFLGSTLPAFADPQRFFHQVWRDHGDVVRLSFGPYVYHLVNDAEALRHVLVENARNYRKGIGYDAFKPLLGQGLLTSEGDFWLRQRRLSQPAFHKERLAGFAEKMAECTREMLDRWKTGERFDLHGELVRLGLRIVGHTLFSIDLAGDGEVVAQELRRGLALIDARATSMLRMPMWVPTRENRQFRSVRRALDGIVYRVLDDHQARPRHDLCTMLMEACDAETGERMSRLQLRDELITLILAGTETTAALISWTLMHLSRKPQVESQVMEELSRLGEREPALGDLEKLGRTARALQESMRLHPPAWKYERQAISDDELGGYHIPAGSLIGITPQVLHRHPRYWQDADVFDPDRFLPEASAARPKFAYLPFGAGPRVCIGNAFAMMEAQIILAMVLQRFRLTIGEDVKAAAAVTLHPDGGMGASATRR